MVSNSTSPLLVGVQANQTSGDPKAAAPVSSTLVKPQSPPMTAGLLMLGGRLPGYCTTTVVTLGASNCAEPLGLDKLTVKFRFPVVCVFAISGTMMVCCVWPLVKVSVPLVAT